MGPLRARVNKLHKVEEHLNECDGVDVNYKKSFLREETNTEMVAVTQSIGRLKTLNADYLMTRKEPKTLGVLLFPKKKKIHSFNSTKWAALYL